ncbi:hypothetical protein FA13DRAFT_1711884 [Coprinellus micaceus]|uniref:Uncharacterized protein n=1 Tax=Coprinellus micaceus TaxID=71717 RepID=A0A4Y7T2D3_COPMI|nr:hypothetical protein FA13DRAFT_1711884 [Coprinellus micaceus]
MPTNTAVQRLQQFSLLPRGNNGVPETLKTCVLSLGNAGDVPSGSRECKKDLSQAQRLDWRGNGEPTLRTPLSEATHNASLPFVGMGLASPGSHGVSARMLGVGYKLRQLRNEGVDGGAGGDEALRAWTGGFCSRLRIGKGQNTVKDEMKDDSQALEWHAGPLQCFSNPVVVVPANDRISKWPSIVSGGTARSRTRRAPVALPAGGVTQSSGQGIDDGDGER